MSKKHAKKFEKELEQHFTQYFGAVLPSSIPDIEIMCTFAHIVCIQKVRKFGKTIAIPLFDIYLSPRHQEPRNPTRSCVGSVYIDCGLCVTGYSAQSNYDYERDRMESYFKVADLIKRNKRKIIADINQIADKYRSEIYEEMDEHGWIKSKLTRAIQGY